LVKARLALGRTNSTRSDVKADMAQAPGITSIVTE